ncbi:MAG: hypothetical protein KAS12_01845 [Candidatus Aenigmarchaeota archaeon]|nr:hypothetical protein [Candidatus Aenigmarchaeota archaeon]
MEPLNFLYIKDENLNVLYLLISYVVFSAILRLRYIQKKNFNEKIDVWFFMVVIIIVAIWSAFFHTIVKYLLGEIQFAYFINAVIFAIPELLTVFKGNNIKLTIDSSIMHFISLNLENEFWGIIICISRALMIMILMIYFEKPHVKDLLTVRGRSESLDNIQENYYEYRQCVVFPEHEVMFNRFNQILEERPLN